MFDAICKEGGEGIISQEGQRALSRPPRRNWLKIKCIQRQEFIIVGWQDSDKRRGFRSLHLAVHDGGKLATPARSAPASTRKMIEILSETMRPLEVDKAAARRAARRSRAARTGWSRSWSARWRSPNSPQRVSCATPASSPCASDKSAKEVVREVPKHLKQVGSRRATRRPPRPWRQDQQPRPRHLPADKLTKGQLADYYAAVADLMMVDSANRPISLVRCPQGRAQEMLFPET